MVGAVKQFALLGELAARLAAIQTAAGYNTDAGDIVLVNPDAVDADALIEPALRIFEQESVSDGAVPNSTRCKIKTMFVIEAVHKLSGAQTALEQAHKVISDVCNAVFGGDVRMGLNNLQLNYEGHRILPRSAGSKCVVIQVRGSHVSAEVFARPI